MSRPDNRTDRQPNGKIVKKIGFVGAGNMGEAFIGALLKAGIFTPSSIFASDVMTDRLDFLKGTYDITPMEGNFGLFMACDIVVLSVKPQQMDEVLAGIVEREGYGISDRKLIISIAAGMSGRRRR